MKSGIFSYEMEFLGLKAWLMRCTIHCLKELPFGKEILKKFQVKSIYVQISSVVAASSTTTS